MIAKEARALLEAMRDVWRGSNTYGSREHVALHEAWERAGCPIDSPETEPAPTELQQAEAWARGLGYTRTDHGEWRRRHERTSWWYLVAHGHDDHPKDGDAWWWDLSGDGGHFDNDDMEGERAALIAAYRARPEAKQDRTRLTANAPAEVHIATTNDHAARLDTHDRLLNAIHDRLAAQDAWAADVLDGAINDHAEAIAALTARVSALEGK